MSYIHYTTCTTYITLYNALYTCIQVYVHDMKCITFIDHSNTKKTLNTLHYRQYPAKELPSIIKVSTHTTITTPHNICSWQLAAGSWQQAVGSRQVCMEARGTDGEGVPCGCGRPPAQPLSSCLSPAVWAPVMAGTHRARSVPPLLSGSQPFWPSSSAG